MRTANVTLYPGGELFNRLLQLDREQCLQLLLPYLQRCRKSGRISGRVADMDFPDGLVIWFGSDEGAIDVHRGRLLFGRRIKWRPLFSLPIRKQTATAATDEALREMICSVYENMG